MPRPGITLPSNDFLADLPLPAVAGSCFAADPTGANRYLFVLVPTGARTASVYRIDTQTRALQLLPVPITTAHTLFGVGTCMVFDGSQGTGGAGYLWLLTPEDATAAGTEWANFQRLDLGNLAAGWVARTVVGIGLAAQLPECAMAHTCSTVVAAATGDDYIYLALVGSTDIYRYGIAGNAWAARGATARGAAAATGVTLIWGRGQPDQIFSNRGGGSTVMDYYGIAGNSFANTLTLIPGTTTWTLGTETFHLSSYGSRGLYLLASGGIIRNFDPVTGIMNPVGSIDGTDGAAHFGNGIAAHIVGVDVFVDIRRHSSTDVQRIRTVF